jgi:hypothetical protein
MGNIGSFSTNTIIIRDYISNNIPYLTSGISEISDVIVESVELQQDKLIIKTTNDIQSDLSQYQGNLHISNIYEKTNVVSYKKYKDVIILILSDNIYYGRRSISKCFVKISNDYVYCNVRGDVSRMSNVEEVLNEVVINQDYFNGLDLNSITEFYFVTYNSPYNKKIEYSDISFIDNSTISYDVETDGLLPAIITNDLPKFNSNIRIEILSGTEELQIEKLQSLMAAKASFITILDTDLETINSENNNSVVNQNNMYYILQTIRVEAFIYNDSNERLSDVNNIVLDKLLHDLRTIVANIKNRENSDIIDIAFLGSAVGDYNMIEDNEGANQARLYNTRFFNFQIKTFVDYDVFDQINKQEIYRDIKISINDKLETPYVSQL